MPLETFIDYFRKSKGSVYITLFIRIKASQRNCIIRCGVYSIIAGIFLVISVAEIVYMIGYPPVYTPYGHYSGASIYIGFAAAALYGTGGVLLCCACCTKEGQ